MTSYPPPANQPANQPGGQPPTGPGPAYGAPVPPPPTYAPAAGVPVKAPVTAWLVPLAGLLGLIGLFTTWFAPYGDLDGQRELSGSNLHPWDDGKIGMLGPILLIVIGGAVAALLLGRISQRFSRGAAHPVVTGGRYAAGAGVVTIVCLIIAWFMLPSQYKIDLGTGGKLSWDDASDLAKENGHTLVISHGPEIGFWLTGVAALLAIIGGVLMILAARNSAAANSAAPANPYPSPPSPPSLQK